MCPIIPIYRLFLVRAFTFSFEQEICMSMRQKSDASGRADLLASAAPRADCLINHSEVAVHRDCVDGTGLHALLTPDTPDRAVLSGLRPGPGVQAQNPDFSGRRKKLQQPLRTSLHADAARRTLGRIDFNNSILPRQRAKSADLDAIAEPEAPVSASPGSAEKSVRRMTGMGPSVLVAIGGLSVRSSRTLAEKSYDARLRDDGFDAENGGEFTGTRGAADGTKRGVGRPACQIFRVPVASGESATSAIRSGKGGGQCVLFFVDRHAEHMRHNDDQDTENRRQSENDTGRDQNIYQALRNDKQIHCGSPSEKILLAGGELLE